jgi:hypothetical protein
MFTSLVASVVLAGSIAMPISSNGNPYLGPKGDWQPLKDAYQVCQETSTGYFSYYLCTERHYNLAKSNLQKA